MNPRAPLLRTARLDLWPLAEDDAPFIVELLNQRSWIDNIGDRGVRTEDDARRWLRDGPMAMLAQHGHALHRIAWRDATSTSLGLCGLVRRDGLDAPDLGYALIDRHAGQGVAREAAAAVLAHARDVLMLARVLAIVSPGNRGSERVLAAVGMRFERMVQLKPQGEPLQLFSTSVS